LTHTLTFRTQLSKFLDLHFSQTNQKKDFYCKELINDLIKIGGSPIDGYSLAVRLVINLIKHDALPRLTEMSDFLVEYGNSLDVAATLNRQYLTNPAQLLFLAKIHLACKAILSTLLLFEIRTQNFPPIRIDQIGFTEDNLNIKGLRTVDNLNRSRVVVARKCILDWVTVRKLDDCKVYLFPHFRRDYDSNPYPLCSKGVEKLTSYMLICRSGLMERLLKLNQEESSRIVSA